MTPVGLAPPPRCPQRLSRDLKDGALVDTLIGAVPKSEIAKRLDALRA